LPYRLNRPFLISDIRALWYSALSEEVPKCQKLKMVCLARMAFNPYTAGNDIEFGFQCIPAERQNRLRRFHKWLISI